MAQIALQFGTDSWLRVALLRSSNCSRYVRYVYSVSVKYRGMPIVLEAAGPPFESIGEDRELHVSLKVLRHRS